MLQPINAVTQQNIFRVQPVKWSEPNRQEQTPTNLFSFAKGSQQQYYTPNHPNMQSSMRANHLDFLA